MSDVGLMGTRDDAEAGGRRQFQELSAGSEKPAHERHHRRRARASTGRAITDRSRAPTRSTTWRPSAPTSRSDSSASAGEQRRRAADAGARHEDEDPRPSAPSGPRHHGSACRRTRDDAIRARRRALASVSGRAFDRADVSGRRPARCISTRRASRRPRNASEFVGFWVRRFVSSLGSCALRSVPMCAARARLGITFRAWRISRSGLPTADRAFNAAVRQACLHRRNRFHPNILGRVPERPAHFSLREAKRVSGQGSEQNLPVQNRPNPSGRILPRVGASRKVLLR